MILAWTKYGLGECNRMPEQRPFLQLGSFATFYRATLDTNPRNPSPNRIDGRQQIFSLFRSKYVLVTLSGSRSTQDICTVVVVELTIAKEQLVVLVERLVGQLR